ncbi:MAG: chitobiase/beta-hexosaminidase C-terminal domain-containing protein [Desulfobaccales bacterium]
MFQFLTSNFLGGGHQKIAIANVVISLFANALTLIKPTSGTFSGKQAAGVYIHCVTGAIYFTFDGTDPATDGSTGHPLNIGDSMTLYDWDNVKRLKFIRQGAVSGDIIVTPLFTAVGVVVADLP